MKVLLADDDPITRSLLARWLGRWGYEVVIAPTGEEALKTLERDQEIRLCILDWMMPGMSGLEVCRALRVAGEEPYIYAILLTSKMDTEDVVAGLEAGADDYLVKPCNPLELEVRLRGGRRVIELQSNLIAAREQLRFEATHDSLTGLLNRRAILEVLHRETHRAERANGSVAVALFDLDHFKTINDTWGHDAGDAVLRALPERLRRGLRAYDVTGRYGGEEFLVVLADCDATTGLAVAERLRLEVASLPVEVTGAQLDITVSVGVAALDLSPSVSPQELVRAADAALYRSKRGGRDRVTLAEPSDFVRSAPAAPTAPEAE